MNKYRPNIYLDIHLGGGAGKRYATCHINNTLELKIKSYLDNLSGQNYKYPIWESCGSGQAISDAEYYYGASAWMTETIESNNIPKTLNEFLSTLWVPNKNMFNAMALSVQIPTTTTTTSTTTTTTTTSTSTTTSTTTTTIYIPAYVKRKGDFRNFFGVNWLSEPCVEATYAQSMGYDFVTYNTNMEKCADITNLQFYIENPENSFPENTYRRLDLRINYTQAQKDYINNNYVWRYNATFPNNIATGWWDNYYVFQAVSDFQQERVFNNSVRAEYNEILSKQNVAKNFTFGGYAYDVPTLKYDWFTWRQNSPDYPLGNGQIVQLSYWNPDKKESSYHPGVTYKYDNFSTAVAEVRKAIFKEAAKVNPNFAIFYEPYGAYNGWMGMIENRADVREFMPLNRTFYCQENGKSTNNPATGYLTDIDFIMDQRIYAKRLITKDYSCSSTPDMFTHAQNLYVACYAAANGAWFTEFGRWGGTGNMPRYSKTADVPMRIKLIRAMVGWENLNDVSLSSRQCEGGTLYHSPLSYADNQVIFSKHPKNGNYYVVYLGLTGIQSNYHFDIYATDGLFRITKKTNDIVKIPTNVPGVYLYAPANSTVLDNGYIFVKNVSVTTSTTTSSSTTTTSSTTTSTILNITTTLAPTTTTSSTTRQAVTTTKQSTTTTKKKDLTTTTKKTTTTTLPLLSKSAKKVQRFMIKHFQFKKVRKTFKYIN
jgi:uncharacterized membrane protein